jgi:hypothetical protein
VTGAIGLGTGAWLLSLNQSRGHTDPTGMRTTYYRDTKAPGVSVCVAGAAALSYAVLQWALFGNGQRLPIVSADRSHAMVGWTGRF